MTLNGEVQERYEDEWMVARLLGGGEPPPLVWQGKTQMGSVEMGYLTVLVPDLGVLREDLSLDSVTRMGDRCIRFTGWDRGHLKMEWWSPVDRDTSPSAPAGRYRLAEMQAQMEFVMSVQEPYAFMAKEPLEWWAIEGVHLHRAGGVNVTIATNRFERTPNKQPSAFQLWRHRAPRRTNGNVLYRGFPKGRFQLVFWYDVWEEMRELRLDRASGAA